MSQHPSAINQPFTGSSVVITGGAGDIGLATAIHLGHQGAQIGLLDIDATKLAAAAQRLRDQGITCATAECNVTESSQVEAALARFVEQFGVINCLFNNVGYQGDFAPVHNYELEDFSRVMSINVTGAFIVLKTFAQHMIVQGGGAIVNTASMAALGGPPNMIAYATSKAALLGMTLTAAKDLAPHNIRVNAISPAYMGPGFMWTRQVELQAAAG
ncbi:MAG: SDR family oxidoreductase, partial [Natronospirillum sp.]